MSFFFTFIESVLRPSFVFLFSSFIYLFVPFLLSFSPNVFLSRFSPIFVAAVLLAEGNMLIPASASRDSAVNLPSRHFCSFRVQNRTAGDGIATRRTFRIWLRMAGAETGCSSSGWRHLCAFLGRTNDLTSRKIERYISHTCHSEATKGAGIQNGNGTK